MARLMDLEPGVGLDGEPFREVVEDVDESMDFDPRVSPHKYQGERKRVGVMIVDHGSKRAAANERLEALCAAYAEAHANKDWVVVAAHMELASPSIAEAFDALVAGGCELVVCHPFFLSPGRHATEDVPELLAAAAAKHPAVTSVMTPALGTAPGLLDLMHSIVADSVRDATVAAAEPSFEDSFFGSIAAAIAAEEAA